MWCPNYWTAREVSGCTSSILCYGNYISVKKSFKKGEFKDLEDSGRMTDPQEAQPLCAATPPPPPWEHGCWVAWGATLHSGHLPPRGHPQPFRLWDFSPAHHLCAACCDHLDSGTHSTLDSAGFLTKFNVFVLHSTHMYGCLRVERVLLLGLLQHRPR